MYITALELSFSDAVASKAKQTGLLRQKELKRFSILNIISLPVLLYIELTEVSTIKFL